MSSPNRTKVLIGSGVLAIVLIAAIAYWPPTFRSEEASGAIGAVKKHHAPQITQKDVVLGNEKTRAQQDVLYGDFFNDSAKLQRLSAALASAASGEEIATASRQLADFELDLQSRYASRMNARLNSIALQAKAMNNVALQSEIDQMEAQLQNKKLAAEEMQQLDSRLSSLVAKASKTAAASRTLNDIDADLGRAFAESNGNRELAARSLQDLTMELNHQAQLSEISDAEQATYFSQIALEARALQSAQRVLASRALDSRLSNATMELADVADQLEGAALQNIKAYLAAQTSMAAALAEMETQLSARMQSRQLNARQLSDFELALNARDTEFRARASADMEQALSAVQQYASNRMQYARLASAPQQLQAAALASRQLDSRHLFARLSNTVVLQARLADFEAALASRQLSARLANGTKLSAQCTELSSRLANRQAQ